MEGDGMLLNGIGGNVSDDVSTSFLKPPEKRSSADDEDEKDGGNVSDDRNKVLRPKNLVTEALLPERSDLQPTLASADFENARADVDRKMKAPVEGDGTLLNAIGGNVSDDVATSFLEPPEKRSSNNLEDRTSDLKMANELEAAKFLKNDCSDLLRMLACSHDFRDKFYLMELLTFFLISLEVEDARPEKKGIIMTPYNTQILGKAILKFVKNKLEKELKKVGYCASTFERRTKLIFSGYENNRRMEPKKVEKRINFSGIVAGAVMASSGIVVGAVITAFCLRHK